MSEDKNGSLYIEIKSCLVIICADLNPIDLLGDGWMLKSSDLSRLCNNFFSSFRCAQHSEQWQAINLKCFMLFFFSLSWIWSISNIRLLLQYDKCFIARIVAFLQFISTKLPYTDKIHGRH